jgi:hypothetical protein
MDGNTFQYDGLRTALPHDIAPGEDVTLQAAVKAPYMSGEYLLEFDMVQERVCWFAQRGSATSSITMRVEQIIV